MSKVLNFVLVLFSQFFIAGLAIAAQAEAGAGATSSNAGLIAIGAGLAIGLAAGGGGVGQGKAAAGALEGIARNPGASAKVQMPMIIGLALIESLVIYALVIAFLLYGKI